MVARRARSSLMTLSIALSVLALGSCHVLEFIFGSVFPSTTQIIKAQADLSSQISSTDGSAFDLRVVTSGSAGYVIVIGPASGSAYDVAYVYDLDLNMKQVERNLISNSGVMLDAASPGHLVLGSRLLNFSDLSLATTISVSIARNGRRGVDGFVSSGSNIFDVQASGSALSCSGMNSAWTNSLVIPTPPSLSAVQTNLNISALLDDGDPSGNVYLVVSPSGGNDNTPTAYFLTIPKADFTSGSIPSNLLDSSPHRDSLYSSMFGFAQGSIFAYDKGSSSFVRINPADASIQGTFSTQQKSSETRFAYAPGGGAFYSFDPRTRVLTKYASWW